MAPDARPCLTCAHGCTICISIAIILVLAYNKQLKNKKTQIRLRIVSKKNIFSVFSRDINRQDEYGLTKLYRAARHGDLETVLHLLKKDADPNIVTGCGLSALHIAAYWGETEIVKALLDAGADPNIDNGKGWTPLHSASLNAGLEGRRAVIKLLIDHKADPKRKDINGWTPSDFVALWEDPDCERLQDIHKHLNQDRDEYTGHQPNMKKLGLDKSPKPNPPPHKPPTNLLIRP